MPGQVILQVEGIDVSYGSIKALHGVNLTIRFGEIVALLGANGAGKSTTLRAISGLIPSTAGCVRFLGEDVTRTSAHQIARLGLGHVPEGRRIFKGMTVLENLELGSFALNDQSERHRRVAEIIDLFPILKQRRKQDASLLSGGEQQMLAMGRAMMAKPKLLLLDEPSMVTVHTPLPSGCQLRGDAGQR